MGSLADVNVTREALRRSVLEDIVARAELTSQTIEGGPLDGIKVVSMGTLRDQVSAALLIPLPPATEGYAEVTTPAVVDVAALCPECKVPAKISVAVNSRLTVEGNTTEIAVKTSSKAMVHMHGQLPLAEGGQVTVDEAIGSIDDLRLRILRAVADVSDAHDAEIDPGPPSSLDAIAAHLDLATESGRSDLEDALYGYANLEEPLVEVVSTKGLPPTYVLTDAGLELVAAADQHDAATADGEADDDQDDAA